jgi:indolepyruvate ferredoxin oxidoreductase
MGDTVFANVMMLGFAWQSGLVPVSLAGAAPGDRAERRRHRGEPPRLPAGSRAPNGRARARGGVRNRVGAVAQAVARSLFKLMAYKDEYEVARLHTQTGFEARLGEEFEEGFRLVHHLAPPMLNTGTDAAAAAQARLRAVDTRAFRPSRPPEAAARHGVRSLRLHR